jgi:hydrogenase expression/formation protein HypD
MKYVTEYRDPAKARALIEAIAKEAHADRQYRFMEFCGGHTHVLSRWGLLSILPPNVKMIHGPGCPVCVLPIGRIDMAIDLALNHDVILCTYADTLRVPASRSQSLFQCRAAGGDVRMVYSPMDAIEIAKSNPEKQVVFFAIGFETTTPPTAVAVKTAKALGLTNFSILASHVLTPAAMEHIMTTKPSDESLRLDGVVGPAHVSTVIGSKPYEPFCQKWKIPVVIAGFEPLDMLEAIRMLIVQVNEKRAEVENEFIRAVTSEGNQIAKVLVEEIFEVRDQFEWRGLGSVPASALKLREAYRAYDAEARFGLVERQVPDNRACACGAILRGEKAPRDCKLFGKVCTPSHPIGACMVSSEGACAAYWRYGPKTQKDKELV